MANIKSAKKRILVNRTKAARNKAIKSAVKTSMKKVEAAVANKDKAAAEVALKDAVSTIDVYKRQAEEYTAFRCGFCNLSLREYRLWQQSHQQS